MISTDGADHVRLRKCLAPMFTRRAMIRWEERVDAVVEQLLAPLAAGDTTYDLIADFTMVPTIIVAEMLGVPQERHADFRRWSNTIVSNLAWGHENEAARAAMLTAATELNAYLREEIERHRVEQPDDMFTAVIKASGEGGVMSNDEVRAAAVLLLAARLRHHRQVAVERPARLRGEPRSARLLVADPSLMPDAIEETLRWRGTVQMIRGSPEGHDPRGRRDQARARWSTRSSPPPTETRPLGEPRRLRHPPPHQAHFGLATARTCAWAPPWPGSRARSRSKRCCGSRLSTGCAASTSARRSSSAARSAASSTSRRWSKSESTLVE